ncbi:hypothetical protein DC498_25710 [Terrimonas sp.]|nr:hypothetical protein DC498_25710 [Terrimonas sp.]
MVKNVSDEITVNKVLRLGLGPCSTCKPSQSYGKTKSTHKVQGPDKGAQRKGKNKILIYRQHFQGDVRQSAIAARLHL